MEMKSTTIIFPISFALFNFIDWAITGVLLGWVIGRVPRSIEWYRRAYLLRKKKKVCIGGPDFLIFRALAISSSPWAIGLSTVCFIIFVIVEVMLSTGSGATFANEVKSGEIMKRSIARYSADEWKNEFKAVEKHFYPCSAYYRDYIAVWPTSLVTDPESGRAKLNCPRNVTTNFLTGNIEKSHQTSVGDLEAEAIELGRKFGSEARKEKIDLPLVFSTEFTQVRPQSFQGFDESIENDRVPTGIVHLQSRKTSPILSCLFETSIGGNNVALRHEWDRRQIVGCISSSRAQNGNVVFIVSQQGQFLQENMVLTLLPATLVGNFNKSRKISLLTRAFGGRSSTLMTRRRRSEIQMVSIIARMVAEGELSSRPEIPSNMELEYKAVFRPTMELWGVILLFLLIITLFGSCQYIRKEALRMFPFPEIIGEDNIIRLWARSKRRHIRAEPKDSCWLRIVDRDGGLRLEACVDEPVSQVYDKRIPLTGIR